MKEEILQAIQKIIKKYTYAYFAYAWEQDIGNLIEDMEKFTALIKWIDVEIEIRANVLPVISPANIMSNDGDLRLFFLWCQEIAVLTACKTEISHGGCSTMQRNNWETCICKTFNVKYNEKLKTFI